MRVRHLSCGTLCPIGGRLMHERTISATRAELCCHCLLIEANGGLVLVDTGLGLQDVAAPRERLAPFFRFECRPLLDPEQTALRQVERLGFDRRDVRHIVLTHLDFDHAGGLDDFPAARIHLHLPEAEAAAAARGVISGGRYRPQQWRSLDRWNLYRPGGEPWFGFGAVREMDGMPPEILLIPLAGHTRGHCGVAVREESGHWLLHAGDAYFYRAEMDLERPWCTPGLRFYQTQMQVDRRQRLANQGRLRELKHAHRSEVTIFSAHDPVELDILSAQRGSVAWRASSESPAQI
jgi:glyoxylase-like metal-dependent hydrolase (beta-lactamase superfamily II)